MAFLSACSGAILAPPALDEAAKARQPAPGRGLIYVYRPSSAGIEVHHTLRVNGNAVGLLDSETYYVLDRPPGKVKLTIESVHSFSLDVDLGAGQTRYVRVRLAPDESRLGGGMRISFSGFPLEANGKEAVEELKHCRLIELLVY
jgi:Protein of unknown function (DUF2846)